VKCSHTGHPLPHRLTELRLRPLIEHGYGPSFFHGLMAQARSYKKVGKRESITYGTDRENKVNKTFIIRQFFKYGKNYFAISITTGNIPSVIITCIFCVHKSLPAFWLAAFLWQGWSTNIVSISLHVRIINVNKLKTDIPRSSHFIFCNISSLLAIFLLVCRRAYSNTFFAVSR
jgi:hypothetical protein